MKRLLYSIGLLLTTAWAATAQDKVQVMTTVTGPREIAAQINELNNLIGRTLVRITNLTDAPVTIVVEGRLEGPEVTARTVRSSLTEAHYITLAPRATEIFTGDRIRNTFSTGNVEIWTAGRIVPIEYFYSYADGSGRLPEGTYNFCFEVYEVNPQIGRPDFSQPVNVQGGQCVSVYARVYDPPLLQTVNDVGGIHSNVGPFDVRASTDGSLRLQWQAPAGLAGGTALQYTVLMAEMLPGDTRDPNQVIQAIDIPSEPLSFYRHTVTDAARVVTHMIMPVGFASPLLPGRTYAIQVTAASADPLNPLPIQNAGKSPVYTFKWGEAPPNTSLTFKTFPANNTHMPFRGMPIIIKYEPYKAEYRSFSADFSIENDYRQSSSFTRQLTWDPNPLEAQRWLTGNRSLNRELAQHVIVSPGMDETTDDDFYNYGRRGDTYTWSAEVTIDERGTPIKKKASGKFTAGMPKSALNLPANRSTVDSGEVTFRFKTGDAPAVQTLTPTAVIHSNNPARYGGYPFRIHETAVLEVARNNRFDSIAYHRELKLDETFMAAGSTAEVKWDTVMNHVYKNLSTTIHIKDTGTYYWRVKWLDNPTGDWNSASYSVSDTWQFNVDSTAATASDGAGRERTERSPCEADCNQEYTYLTPGRAFEISVGERIKVGQFDMEVTHITGGAGERTYTGRGVITNFGFVVNRVLVEFSALKAGEVAGGGKRMFAGSVKASGGGNLADNLIHVTGVNDISPGIGGGLSFGESALAVPFGWDQAIDGHKIIAKIESITFSHNQARARFVFGYEFPGEFAGHPVVFATEACIVPGGFREEFDVFLERDLVIGDVRPDNYSLVLKGRTRTDATGPTGLDEITKFSWDCSGFKSLKLAMEVRFPRETVLPENETTGQIEESGQVSGFLNLLLDRSTRDAGEQWGFIGSVSFPKSFQFDFWPGWGFKIQDAVFDFSDSRNDAAMAFPAGYDFTLLGGTGGDARLRNTWQGFFLKSIQVRVPKQLTDGEDNGEPRRSFNISNLLIDKTGFSGFVGAVNVAAAAEAGWRISLDTVSVGIVQTRSISGRIAGSLAVPFFEEGHRLDYSSLLNVGFDGKVEYNFQINVPPDRPLKMNLWQASMTLARSSYLRFSYSSASSKARFQGLFNGSVGLDSAEIGNIPGLSMSGIIFENFAFDTEDPRFFKFSRVNRTQDGSQLVFSFASPQHTAGGFPLNIRDITLSMDNDGGDLLPKLGFVTELSLSDVGFKASLGLNVVGRMRLSPFTFSIDGVEVTEIGIDCDFNGFKLGGMLQFYDDHEIYGNGVFGRITAELPMGIKGKLETRFGTVGNAADPSSYYDYWYVDGLIKINPGITVFSGFAIYGFGGGAYYHMTMNRPPAAGGAQATLDAPAAMADGAGQSSGVTYRPDRSSGLGFMATVVLGTQPNEDVFNMDVTLRAQFSTSGGLQLIEFEGNGYVMNQMKDRSGNPPVRAKVVFGYYNIEGREYIQGNFDVFLNVYGLIRGVGEDDKLVTAELYADLNGSNDGQWWFYMGKDRPIDQRCGLLIDLGILRLEATNYIMVGHGIPADLPPLPPFIHDLLYAGSSQLDNPATTGGVTRVRSNSALQNGQGFAFGMGFDMTNEFNFLMFYARLRLMLGFDVNISQNSSRVCAESGEAPGVNGWYAQGQAYAAIEGDIGIKVDLFFIQGKFSILNAAAALAMRAKLPNPNYFQGRAAFRYSILNGAISGHCNFNMEFGEECTIVTNDPLAGLEFINDMRATDDGSPTSVFSDIQTSFNFAMNQVLEIEEESNGQPVVRRFEPYIYAYTLRKADNTAVSGVRWEKADQGYLASIRRDEAFEPRTAHRATIEVRVKQLLPDGRGIDVRKNDTIAREVRVWDFITGDRPEYIMPGNVLLTYPIIRQPNFLQQEGKSAALGALAGKGYVKIKQQDYLFEPESQVIPPGVAAMIPAFRHTFLARFTPVGSGAPVETAVTYNAGQDLVTFEMPVLDPAKTYRLQVVKRTVPNPAFPQVNNTVPYRAVQVLERRMLGGVNFEELDDEGNAIVRNYQSAVELRRRNVSRSSASREQITVLFELPFRTSRHQSFSEKMANVTLGNATYRFGGKQLEASTTGEGFDVLEAPGSATAATLVRLAHHLTAAGSFVPTNPQLTAINQFYSTFESMRNISSKTMPLPALPSVPAIGYRYRNINVGNYGVLAITRSQTAVSLTRLSPSRYAPPTNTLSMTGSFSPLIPTLPPVSEAPASGGTGVAGQLQGAATTMVGYPAANMAHNPFAVANAIVTPAGIRYTVNDLFDWYAITMINEMKMRANGYANATLLTTTEATSVPHPLTFDLLDITTRTRLRTLGATTYPLPAAGYRYRIDFEYHVPLPNGQWKKTSAVTREFTITP